MVTCFSAGCCGRHGNRPVRYCKRCHANQHSSEVGAAAETHLYQTSPPPINTRECGAEELVCTVEAVIRCSRSVYTDISKSCLHTHVTMPHLTLLLYSYLSNSAFSRKQKYTQNSVSLSSTGAVRWACPPPTTLWTTSNLTTRRMISMTSGSSASSASGSWCVITGFPLVCQ